LHIIDNGHTIMISYAPGSSIRVGDRQLALKQFHFHRPSEEKINGKTYEMVVHLVHADQDGNLAVVAILLESGKNNPLENYGTTYPRKRRKKNGWTPSRSTRRICCLPTLAITHSPGHSPRRPALRTCPGSC